MSIVERRDTDEMVGHIMQQESARKMWMLLTLVGFIVTTAVLFATKPVGAGVDLVMALAMNGGFAVLCIVFYRARVKGKDRIGMVMPIMLAIVSTVLVWVLSRR